jgi:hypothetical protein
MQGQTLNRAPGGATLILAASGAFRSMEKLGGAATLLVLVVLCTSAQNTNTGEIRGEVHDAYRPVRTTHPSYLSAPIRRARERR